MNSRYKLKSTRAQPKWLRLLLIIEHWAARLCLICAMCGLCILAILSFSQVILRFGFHNPTSWSDVTVRIVMIWTVLLTVATTFREGVAISSTMLMSKLSGTSMKVLEVLINVAILIFLVIIIFAGTQLVLRTGSQKIAGLSFSIQWVYLALPFGGSVAALSILTRLIDQLRFSPFSNHTENN
jgi:TRAP-type C4-dicarboxylate transport system permease small subunit